MSPEERHVNVKALGLWFICLSQNHLLKDCLSKSTCRINYCNQRHNTLLHREKTALKSNSVNLCNKQQARANDEFEVFTTKVDCSARVQVVQVTVHSLSQKQTLYALLDSGSTSSFMSPQLAKMLEVKPMETSDVIIRGFNSQKNHSTKTVQIQFSDANDSERFNCQNILVIEDFQLPKLKEHPTDIVRVYPHLNEITLTTLADLQFEVLIGSNLYSLIVARSVKEGPPNAPTAVETKLGWSIAGPHPKETSMESFFCQQYESRDEDLYDAVLNWWKTDSYGTCQTDANDYQEDERAQEILQKTCNKVDGRHETGLLWRDDSQLHNNRFYAERHLASLLLRLNKTPVLKTTYEAGIESDITKGYIRKVRPEVKNITKQNG